jgi:hypothetical protein
MVGLLVGKAILLKKPDQTKANGVRLFQTSGRFGRVSRTGETRKLQHRSIHPLAVVGSSDCLLYAS